MPVLGRGRAICWSQAPRALAGARPPRGPRDSACSHQFVDPTSLHPRSSSWILAAFPLLWAPATPRLLSTSFRTLSTQKT